jgi:hypothetical protein
MVNPLEWRGYFYDNGCAGEQEATAQDKNDCPLKPKEGLN